MLPSLIRAGNPIRFQSQRRNHRYRLVNNPIIQSNLAQDWHPWRGSHHCPLQRGDLRRYSSPTSSLLRQALAPTTTLTTTLTDLHSFENSLNTMPQPPLQYHTYQPKGLVGEPTAAAVVIDRSTQRQHHAQVMALHFQKGWMQLTQCIQQADAKRQLAFDVSCRIQVLLVLARQRQQQQPHQHAHDDAAPGVTTITAAEAVVEQTDVLPSKAASWFQNPLDWILQDSAIQSLLMPSSSLSLSASSSIPDVASLLPSTATRLPRPANLSYKMEDLARWAAFEYFLETGALIPPAPCWTDEEYLAGACMALPSYELTSYAVGRATVRDVDSVQAAQTIVQATLQHVLLPMDFRNGPLRRKYDSVKYSLQSLETILYELSITSSSSSSSSSNPVSKIDSDATSLQEPHNKKHKAESNLDDETTNACTGNTGSSRSETAMSGEGIIPLQEIQALHRRMEQRDELREQLIKISRDAQKAAKQAIFALHRQDSHRARQLLQTSHNIIEQQLRPITLKEPPLRQGGTYSNVLEEYVEARMFAAWIYGRDFFVPPAATTIATSISSSNEGLPDGDGDTKDQSSTSTPAFDYYHPSGVILSWLDFVDTQSNHNDKDTNNNVVSSNNDAPFLLPEEYLGGLCDLTGEIGRYAVHRGTARDVPTVQLSWQTCWQIHHQIQSMEQRLPGGIGKKQDMIRRSVEKLQRMLYEMSLSEAAGGRVVTTQAVVVGDETDVVVQQGGDHNE